MFFRKTVGFCQPCDILSRLYTIYIKQLHHIDTRPSDIYLNALTMIRLSYLRLNLAKLFVCMATGTLCWTARYNFSNPQVGRVAVNVIIAN